MYRAEIAPSRATIVSGPIGLSATTCVRSAVRMTVLLMSCSCLLGETVDVVVAGGPQVLDGVGPPRPPGGRARGEGSGSGGQPERRRGHADAEVGRDERIRVAERSHGDRLDRPGTEPGQPRQPEPGLVPVSADAEVHLA